MIPNPEINCFYKIKEFTKGELVSVGSDGNILRWGETGEDTQKWLIVPIDNDRCKIITKQNGEYMSIDPFGNIRRWALVPDEKQNEQIFKFVNPDDQGRYNIQESTKNEFVAVGSNGNILRWAESHQDDQRFQLIQDNPPIKPQPRKSEVEPGDIGDIPRLTGYDAKLPEKTQLILVGETIIPSVMINDNRYSDKLSQFLACPYYKLSRYQYWDRRTGRGALLDHDGKTETTRTIEVTTGISETESLTVEKTVGFKITIGLGFNFEGGATASLGFEITNELKTTYSTETTKMKETTRRITWQFKIGKRTLKALWSLVDHYELRRAPDDSEVTSWEITLDDTQKEDAYQGE